ncbi:hypothetical protein BN961_00563 [Afipia felis]|uniref:Uncharacterized protein n=1 Tax=Afipia felis TaxID=1035 RepID=A0A090MHX2_AFIFE|nr:hypothetical protein BN961_00563 [Afipia felis]
MVRCPTSMFICTPASRMMPARTHSVREWPLTQTSAKPIATMTMAAMVNASPCPLSARRPAMGATKAPAAPLSRKSDSTVWLNENGGCSRISGAAVQNSENAPYIMP